MKIVLLISFLLISAQCTTHPHSEGRSDYVDKIESNSAGDKQFSGLYDNFEFRSTVLTQDISKSIHDRMDKFYDWSDQESQEKWQQTADDMQTKTKLWLSFFTPDRKNDNLANKVSIWKVYLVADGTRYEGRATKANNNFEEAKALFPYHSRWATAYYVDFPVPTAQIEGSDVKLVITGPLGRREVKFPKTL